MLLSSAELEQVPDFEIIQNLPDKVKKKWRKIGLQLKIPHGRLKNLEGRNYKECFTSMLSLWEKEATPKNTFTWTAFINALSSDEIEENEVMADILGERLYTDEK